MTKPKFKAKLPSTDVDCPNCEHDKAVTASEADRTVTKCEKCGYIHKCVAVEGE